MRTLIISDYDSGCEFNIAALIDEDFILYSEKTKKVFGLMRDELLSYLRCEDEKVLKQEIKKFIVLFDFILVCENGGINFYKVSNIEKPDKGRIYD